MDFQKDVIDKSFQQPVVVDFWASWCGPCKVLGPTIEQIAEEQKDKWTLVKVDTEAHQDLARAYEIQSIPNVKLFHKGAVIAEFMGALPRTSILNWLEEYLPDAQKDDLNAIIERLAMNDPLALGELQAFTQNFPEQKEARLALAQNIVFQEPQQALDLIQDFGMGYKFYDEANYIKDLVNFIEHQGDDSAVGKKISAAQMAAKNNDIEAAIQLIIEAATIDKNYADELPRKAGVALFRTLGTSHPLSKTYRWKFDMVLY